MFEKCVSVSYRSLFLLPKTFKLFNACETALNVKLSGKMSP